MAHETLIETGRYRGRLARDAADLHRAQALRAEVFRGGSVARDEDAFDPLCRHMLVETRADGALVAACRLLSLADGGGITRSYAAQFYALDRLSRFPGRMLEVGRFCVRPGAKDPEILRVAWAGLTRIVDEDGVGMLFGCTSFPGTKAEPHRDALALLAERHLAPDGWRPGEKGGEIVRFACDRLAGADLRQGLRRMPALLRSYLAMGGWVSDHAVIDRDLGTLHVFTGLEVSAVPPARARALRGLVGDQATPAEG